MEQSSEDLIKQATLLVEQDQIQEANGIYKKLCALNIFDADNLCALGGLDAKLGQLILAIQRWQKALSINPQHARSAYSLANTLLSLGRIDEALSYCQSAVQSDPVLAEAWMLLGRIQLQQGKYKDSENSSLRAVALLPECAETHLLLANALMVQRELVAATDAYRKVVNINPEHVGALRNLATLSWERGDVGEAIEYCVSLMKYEPGQIGHRHNFIQALNALIPDVAGEDLLDQIRICFEMSGLDLQYLVKPVTRILKNSNDFHDLIEVARRSVEKEVDDAVTDHVYDGMFQMELFHLLLIKTVITDPDYEVLLTAIRRAFLRIALADVYPSESALCRTSFILALACQCFNNEYVYRQHPDEITMVEKLSGTLACRLESRALDSTEFEFMHAVLCMYKPLYMQEWLIEELDPDTYKLSSEFRHIEKRQWHDYCAEALNIKEIESITTTSDPISIAVKNQYEESPYPRWLSVGQYTPKHYVDVIHEMFEQYKPESDRDEVTHVLNAGCGTGRHSIMSATKYSNAEVLAVDLSKSSLAYAKRCADELGINNITFKQADILKLNKLNRRFHIIECGGVLHHIEKTEVALNILADLLHTGGLIMLGLYSQIARRNVYKCADYLASRGYGKTIEDVLCARQEIFALEDNRPEKRVLQSPDFYSLSSCRDLLFHEHEHSYQLLAVAEMIQRTGLVFLGFEHNNLQVKKYYRQRFPDDPAMTNLKYWHIYENEHPETFVGMYMMWCQKT